MIFRIINPLLLILISLFVVACGSGSSSSSSGTMVSVSAVPMAVSGSAMPAGAKTFNNDLGDSFTLTHAYLVISSVTIETDCDARFHAQWLLNALINTASAHTDPSPTSTGVPYVINLLEPDLELKSLGAFSPPPAEYCGLSFDLFAADDDALQLPLATDMIGRTLYIQGQYTTASGDSGVIHIDTGAALFSRHLLLPVMTTVSESQPRHQLSVSIQYDRWFDSVDPVLLQQQTQNRTSPGDDQVNQLLNNVVASIHSY